MLSRWKRWVTEFYAREDGPTSVEYAITEPHHRCHLPVGHHDDWEKSTTTFKTVSSKLGSASS